MKFSCIFCLVFILGTGLVGGWGENIWGKKAKKLPEEGMTAYQLISTKGYPVETHEVVTEDGYRLGLFRIPPKNPNAPVVFLQHGLLMSCTCWLENDKNESLAYILADAGYDVWLGNFRGSTYSRLHKSLDKDSTEYWSFSWDHMAKYDLTSMMDYALKISNKSDLYYVGHSEGTLTAFAKFSEDPQYAKKIRHFFALAPIWYLNHIKGLVRLLGEHTTFVQKVTSWFGYKEFLAQDWLNKILSRLLCDRSLINPICSGLIFMIMGPDSSGLNRTRIPVYLSHVPAGTSTQNMVHFGQLVQSDHCKKYDFGSDKANIEHYGQRTPPSYNVGNLTVPVSLYWGNRDWLADSSDVAQLTSQLTTVVHNVWVKDANHIDFVWGVNAPTIIYKPLLSTMQMDVASRK